MFPFFPVRILSEKQMVAEFQKNSKSGLIHENTDHTLILCNIGLSHIAMSKNAMAVKTLRKVLQTVFQKDSSIYGVKYYLKSQ